MTYNAHRCRGMELVERLGMPSDALARAAADHLLRAADSLLVDTGLNAA